MKIIKNSFLSIGECMVELSPAGNNWFDQNFAGDTFNTAWYMRKLLPVSSDVSYFTSVGNDKISTEMIRFMDEAGIQTSQIVEIEDRTVGLYMIHTTGGERSFTYWRNNSAAKKFACDIQRLNAAMDGVGIIFFSGISIAILSPEDRQNFYDALTLARGKGSKIVFDPNLRPALWSNTFKMCEEISHFAECADILLPSFDDEAMFFGDENPQATLTRYLSCGAELVVVKNGSAKILAGISLQDIIEYTPAVIDNPVDTTAAGDAFNAGFLSTYLSGDSLENALAAGAKLSSKVIGQRGALVDL